MKHNQSTITSTPRVLPAPRVLPSPEDIVKIIETIEAMKIDTGSEDLKIAKLIKRLTDLHLPISAGTAKIFLASPVPLSPAAFQTKATTLPGLSKAKPKKALSTIVQECIVQCLVLSQLAPQAIPLLMADSLLESIEGLPLEAKTAARIILYPVLLNRIPNTVISRCSTQTLALICKKMPVHISPVAFLAFLIASPFLLGEYAPATVIQRNLNELHATALEATGPATVSLAAMLAIVSYYHGAELYRNRTAIYRRGADLYQAADAFLAKMYNYEPDENEEDFITLSEATSQLTQWAWHKTKSLLPAQVTSITQTHPANPTTQFNNQ